MKVSFRSAKLAKTLNNQVKRRRKYGKRADLIEVRLGDLLAADHLGILSRPPLLQMTDFHPLRENRKGQFAVTVGHPYRLVFIAAEPSHDLNLIDHVIVIDITDYH